MADDFLKKYYIQILDKAKKDIREGIQEYESRDNLLCLSCISYNDGLCEKELLMTDDCPEYQD